MGDIIILLLVFLVVGRLLRGVFGGFSKSSFRDDKLVWIVITGGYLLILHRIH